MPHDTIYEPILDGDIQEDDAVVEEYTKGPESLTPKGRGDD